MACYLRPPPLPPLTLPPRLPPPELLPTDGLELRPLMELLPALTELRLPTEELEELRPLNVEREGALVERLVTVLLERLGAGVVTVPRLLGVVVLR